MKNKKIKKITATLAVTLTLASTGYSVCAPALNAYAATQTESYSQSKSAKSVKDTEKELIDAVDAAKEAGLTVNAKDTESIVAESKDWSTVSKDVISKYEDQLAKIKGATDKYKEELANYEKELADWNSEYGTDDGQDVVDPTHLLQELILNTEPNATVEGKTLSDKVEGKLLTGEDASTDYVDDENIPGSYAVYGKDGGAVSGDVAEVTYTNLENASYDGQKITKIVVTISDIQANSGVSQSRFNGGKATAVAYKDPARTLAYYNSKGVTYSPQYYGENGELIDFANKHAYLSIGSLNARNDGDYVSTEKAKGLNDVNVFGFAGSSVTKHDDNSLYSDNSNWDEDIPAQYQGWDVLGDSKAIYGAGLMEITGSKPSIEYSIERDSNSLSDAVWGSSSTTLPESIVPPMPEKPVAPEVEYQLFDIKGNAEAPTKAIVDADGNLVQSIKLKAGETVTYQISGVVRDFDEFAQSKENADNDDDKSSSSSSSSSSNNESSSSSSSDESSSSSSDESSSSNESSLSSVETETQSETVKEDSTDNSELEGTESDSTTEDNTNSENAATSNHVFTIQDDLDDNHDLKEVKIYDGDTDITDKFDINRDEEKESFIATYKGDVSEIVGHDLKTNITALIKKDADFSKYETDDEGNYIIHNVGAYGYDGELDQTNETEVLVPKEELPQTGISKLATPLIVLGSTVAAGLAGLGYYLNKKNKKQLFK